MQKLGKRGLEFMESKFKLAEEHEIAIFLSPKFKCLKMFSEPNKSRIFQNIGLKLLEIELKENTTPENLHQEHNVTIQKNTSNSSLFSEWEDGENNEDLDNRRKYEKELEAIYISNLLDFWKRQNHIFPHLSVLARQILAIPASSASSERSFSVAGRLIEELRSCLSGTSVDSILFLNNHFKNKK
ncbi:unnamed protein product [Macrosiphum euphorbiae]|uniref:HAT C-terminal dimerisation domain-containing protein n=1 Tax=Macrosiphum euphorbiae TaxID=13131 RepID=A0AAV0W9D4_9HEMI|nr:unnamed protein product [Macrosiphum euphorbiae]